MDTVFNNSKVLFNYIKLEFSSQKKYFRMKAGADCYKLFHRKW